MIPSYVSVEARLRKTYTCSSTCSKGGYIIKMAASDDLVYGVMCMTELPEETMIAILQALSIEDTVEVVIPPEKDKLVPRSPEITSIPDHSNLELMDPTPDIHRLFQEYNIKHFFGCLFDVVVGWGTNRMSPRTAGYCCYEGDGGLCQIKLNKSLLQFRSRLDLVSTLLHEMIHAYLFVTQKNTDRDGHGEVFMKEARRVGKSEGCKITIYHSFHDETKHLLDKTQRRR